MKLLLYTCLFFSFSALLSGQELSEKVIIERARATIGADAALDGLVTLELVGRLEPVGLAPATLLIVARKPQSQRLEIKVDDIVETTILEGNKGCIIRSNLSADTSQMRNLTSRELERVIYSTRQFFTFFRPDFKNGETVSLVGTESYRDQRCYKLIYEYSNGPKTIRYFSVQDDTLVATISEKGLVSVGVGSQIVDGIKFPKEIEYYQGERKLHTILLDVVKVNKPLTAGIFNIPGDDTN